MAKQQGTKTGIYRSKFESRWASNNPAFEYEQDKLPYIIPATNHVYHPDFTVAPNIFIELKGLFSAKDRAKTEMVLAQHPNIILIFVFLNPNLKLGSRLGTCLEWCNKRNIPAFGEKDVLGLRNYLNGLK